MRGETPEIFEDSRSFVDSLDITRLHVFSYSERPDTMALKIPYIVDQHTKHLRTRRMMALSDRKRRHSQKISRHGAPGAV